MFFERDGIIHGLSKNFEFFDLQLPTTRSLGRFDDLAFDFHGSFLCQFCEGFESGLRRISGKEHPLHRGRSIAQQNELHLPARAEVVDPTP